MCFTVAVATFFVDTYRYYKLLEDKFMILQVTFFFSHMIIDHYTLYALLQTVQKQTKTDNSFRLKHQNRKQNTYTESMCEICCINHVQGLKNYKSLLLKFSFLVGQMVPTEIWLRLAYYWLVSGMTCVNLICMQASIAKYPDPYKSKISNKKESLRK